MAVLRWSGKQSRRTDRAARVKLARAAGSHTMNGFEIVLVVLASALVTGAASYATFRLVGVELRRRHFEVGTTIFLQAGVIYAVFLAFIFGQALTSYVDADNAVDQECAALHGASMIAAALPAKPREEMKDALLVYIAAVIDPEWAAMRETRRASPVAETAQIALIERANTLDLTAPKDIAVQARLVTLLVEAHRDREERIFQAGQGIPAGLWAMVLAYCGVLVGLVFFSSLETAWSHATMSAIFGALNAIVLLACFLLQYPFEGPFRLGSTSFVTTQVRVVGTLGP